MPMYWGVFCGVGHLSNKFEISFNYFKYVTAHSYSIFILYEQLWFVAFI